jgi:hypothetical protein
MEPAGRSNGVTCVILLFGAVETGWEMRSQGGSLGGFGEALSTA